SHNGELPEVATGGQGSAGRGVAQRTVYETLASISARVALPSMYRFAKAKAAYFTLKKPSTMGFKVTNFSAEAHFWVAVPKKSELSLAPLYGSTVPTPFVVGEGKTALLAEGEDAFYITVLPKVEYRVIAELTNARKQASNIQGYLVLLDGDSGNQEVHGQEGQHIRFQNPQQRQCKHELTR
ncbi:MAG: hypothetical protein ACRETL_08625, partial [Gammaproteobacteria bacterium]